MNKQLYEKLENILYQYACDIITAKTAKESILKLDHKVNWKNWIDNITEVESVLNR